MDFNLQILITYVNNFYLNNFFLETSDKSAINKKILIIIYNLILKMYLFL